MARDGSIAADQLKSFVERVERLEEDRRNLGTDIKDVYSEAKATGFDVKTMKAVVRLRRLSPADRQEADLLLDTYKAALGM
ncbi:MAG: DUF2312 domain-containing protein [Alphaproteobacteria bacterium]|nr:DUF2312 domain-containing protein [Alphaproteobacteria bacterium]